MLWYPSAWPATMRVAASIVSYRPCSEPCRQYALSVCSSSHRSIQGSVRSMRSSQRSRQPDPASAGTGGSAFIATIESG
jgi:hypothetical protein